ncbi:MAG: EF-hand domain-containing protein [Gemmataceae bacterium]
MFRLLLGSTLICAMGLVIGTAEADDDAKRGQRPSPEELFKKLDTNNDGKISKEEFSKFGERFKERVGEEKFKEFQSRMFSRLDADGDGFISAEEFKKFGEFRGGDKKRPDFKKKRPDAKKPDAKRRAKPDNQE